MLCHRILYQGWQLLFASSSHKGKHSFTLVVQTMVQEASEHNFRTEDSNSFQRQARVRSAKAGNWIGKPSEMIADLVLATVCLRPNEEYLFKQMKIQSLDFWTGSGVQALPFLSLVQLHKSPAVAMLEQYRKLVSEPLEDVLRLLVGREGLVGISRARVVNSHIDVS